MLGDRGGELVERDARRVLRRDDDGLDGLRHDAVVPDRDLGLAVGRRNVELARLADARPGARPGGAPARSATRHVLGGLVRREAEHDALVAGALAVERVDAGAGAGVERLVDALRDVGRLRADRDLDAAGATVEADVRRVVADAGDDVTDELGDLDVALGRDLAGDVHEPGRHHRLDGDPACGSTASRASRMLSEIWSQILSGCPSVTDSDVKRRQSSAATSPGLSRWAAAAAW